MSATFNIIHKRIYSVRRRKLNLLNIFMSSIYYFVDSENVTVHEFSNPIADRKQQPDAWLENLWRSPSLYCIFSIVFRSFHLSTFDPTACWPVNIPTFLLYTAMIEWIYIIHSFRVYMMWSVAEELKFLFGTNMQLCFWSFAEPITTIHGSPDLYIDTGSTVNLTCIVRHLPEPPATIQWTHNNEVGAPNTHKNTPNYITSSIHLLTTHGTQHTAHALIVR